MWGCCRSKDCSKRESIQSRNQGPRWTSMVMMVDSSYPFRTGGTLRTIREGWLESYDGTEDNDRVKYRMAGSYGMRLRPCMQDAALKANAGGLRSAMRSHSKLESKFANREAKSWQAEGAGFAVKVESCVVDDIIMGNHMKACTIGQWWSMLLLCWLSDKLSIIWRTSWHLIWSQD